MAGGNPVEVFNAGAYNRTVYAKQGDLGSKVLKPRPSGTVWKRGGIGVTRWQMTARHGGGSVAFVFLAAVGAAALLAGLLLLVGRMEVGGSVAAAFV